MDKNLLNNNQNIQTDAQSGAMALEQQTPVYKYLKGYDEKGKPIFKKRIKDDSILKKRDRLDRVIFPIVFVILCVHIFTLMFPIGWMFMSSLKDPLEYAAGEPFALPKTALFSNFITAFTMLKVGNTNFVGMIWNSVWYTGLKTFMCIMIPCTCGYTISRYKFWGRNVLVNYVMIMLLIPIFGGDSAYMKLIGQLGYYNTPFYVPMSNLSGLTGGLLIYNGFFKGVSISYSEAAKIEGANAFHIYFKIIIPQAMPLLLTYGITQAIANWNAYQDMILYMPSYPTLASGLYEYQANTVRAANYPVYFAGIMISAIPTVILFATFSGKIMTNMTIGGLKG